MSNPRLLTSLTATIAALGLYFTLGVLDQVEVGGHLVRLALLPGWLVLLTLLFSIALLFTAARWLLGARGARDRQASLSVLTLPLLSLGVLALPYLPVLPDRWPVLQALAGPLAGIVWLVVTGLQGWVLWHSGVIGLPPVGRWRPNRLTGAVLVATLAISGLAAWRLTATPAFPGGDEPHYLVIAQSLWRDGDLDIHNNHQRGDYYEFSSAALAPHYLRPGIDGGIYSIHPILMPILMAPVYAAGGYAGVVAMLVLLASLAATLAWRWTRDRLDDAGAATFAWFAIVGSTPYLFNSFTVYPETCAALTVMIAWVLTVTTPAERSGLGRHLVIGVACGTLPWLSTKYAPMSAALMLVAFARLSTTGAAALLRERKVWALATPYTVSLLAWFVFFYAYWGSPLPTAPYGDHGQTSPLTILRGAPGLLLDQEYGLLAFAPVYILAATGLAAMWRSGGERRRLAIEIVLVFTALLGSVGAFALWWGGSASPARPIVSGLLLLALPMAEAYRRAPDGSAQRAAQYLLLWIGTGIAVTLAVAQNGLLIDNGRDGTAALLEFWSPRWELWSLAPTFTLQNTPTAYLHAGLWLAVASIAAAVLARGRHARSGAAALLAMTVFVSALVTIALIMPLLPTGGDRPSINLASRSRLVALDGFDAQRRSSAVIYDPARVVAAPDVLPHLTLSVSPSARNDRTPVRLIHNGRFSLPAGSYRIDVSFGADAPSSAIALQVGRLGAPLESWTVQPGAGQVWHTTIRLPVDANFIGFVGSPEVESAIARITITPEAIVDATARPRVPEVLAARRYAEADLFFHDEHLYLERTGLWTRGGRIASMTVVPAPDRTVPLVFQINSGSRGNTATLSTAAWRQSRTLVPGQVAEIELPAPVQGAIPLTITADSYYRPRDLEPASRDPRVLGVWMQFKP